MAIALTISSLLPGRIRIISFRRYAEWTAVNIVYFIIDWLIQFDKGLALTIRLYLAVYIEVDGSTNRQVFLSMLTAGVATRAYNIRVTQVIVESANGTERNEMEFLQLCFIKLYF